jgi:hypothetical protein
MAITRGPKIVRNGLVLALDAADINSYIGSGTSWKDMTGNENSGTLVNGPSFSGSNGGSIVFDGIDDYVILNGGNNLNNWNADGINASNGYRGYTSANVWFKVSTISTGGINKMIFSDGSFEYGFIHNNASLYFGAYGLQATTIVANTWYNACLVANLGRPNIGTYVQSGTTTITCTTSYPITMSNGNTISINFSSGTAISGNYIVTVTGTYAFTITSASATTTSGNIYFGTNTNISYLTSYLNGIQIGSQVSANTINGANDAPFALGRDGNGVATSYFTGNIAIFQLYNRALTSTEILQNYNATKSRFRL